MHDAAPSTMADSTPSLMTDSHMADSTPHTFHPTAASTTGFPAFSSSPASALKFGSSSGKFFDLLLCSIMRKLMHFHFSSLHFTKLLFGCLTEYVIVVFVRPSPLLADLFSRVFSASDIVTCSMPTYAYEDPLPPLPTKMAIHMPPSSNCKSRLSCSLACL